MGGYARGKEERGEMVRKSAATEKTAILFAWRLRVELGADVWS